MSSWRCMLACPLQLAVATVLNNAGLAQRSLVERATISSKLEAKSAHSGIASTRQDAYDGVKLALDIHVIGAEHIIFPSRWVMYMSILTLYTPLPTAISSTAGTDRARVLRKSSACRGQSQFYTCHEKQKNKSRYSGF